MVTRRVTSRVTAPTARRVTGDGVSGVTPGVYEYLRPDGVSKYLRPDGVSLYKRPASPQSVLPGFTKMGVKLTKPAWLETALPDNRGIYFPRVIENDLYRSVLTGLPETRFSVLYSSDHSTGTGYLGRADFDSFEGTWTDNGSAIHSGAGQRETPFPLFDSENSRVLVYYHDTSSDSEHWALSGQSCRVGSSVDLESIDDIGRVIYNARHGGYQQFEVKDSGKFFASGFAAPTPDGFMFANYETDDPTFFGQPGNIYSPNLASVLPATKKLVTAITWFDWNGTRYGLGAISSRPITAWDCESIVAFPVDRETLKPTGGYYTLIEPGSSGSADATLGHGAACYVVDGSLYLIYLGADDAGDNWSLFVAKGGTANIPRQAPQLLLSYRGLPLLEPESTDWSWDASQLTIPTDATVSVVAGSNGSSFVDDDYYEFSVGGSGARDINLQLPKNDASAVDSISVVIEDVNFFSDALARNEDMGNVVEMGFVDSISSPENGVAVRWYSQTSDTETGLLVEHNSGTETANSSVGIPLVADSYQWHRDYGYKKLGLLLSESGDRFTITIDDSVAFTKDISSSVTFGANVGFYVRVAAANTYPTTWTRFKRIVKKIGTAGYPLITQQPERVRAFAGNNVSFSVAAENATSYQWQTQAKTGTTWSNITGETAATLSLTGVATGDDGKKYRCSVTNTTGTTQSEGVVLRVQAAITPTIDTYTGAARGYSVRKLRTAYSGHCMRIRRSDGELLDVGFDSNGILDVAAIESFCGNRSATVAIWYDQAGSDNLVQTTPANQPFIAWNGKVVRFRSKPILDFFKDRWLGSSAGTYAQPNHIIAFAKGNTTKTNITRCLIDGQASRNALFRTNTDVLQMFAGTLDAGATLGRGHYAIAATFNGASSLLLKDEVDESIGDVGANSFDGIKVGEDFNGGSYWQGLIGEIIHYNGSIGFTMANLSSDTNTYWGGY